MGRQTEGHPQGGPLKLLTFAWTVIVGTAFVPIVAYAQSTGNLELLIAFLVAALLVGVALFIAMGLANAGVAPRAAPRDKPIANVARSGIFGRR